MAEIWEMLLYVILALITQVLLPILNQCSFVGRANRTSMFSGTLNSEAAGFPAGHVPDRISCTSYANEHHVFKLAHSFMNKCQE